MSSPEPQDCLAATAHVDSDHPALRARSRRTTRAATQREQAVALYYAVRDGFRYDPYPRRPRERGHAREQRAGAGGGWCVTKAALLAAAARAAGIPRAGLRRRAQPPVHRAHARDHAHRRLHLARLRRAVAGRRVAQGDSAFNLGLCERFGLLPLEFDGQSDSIYHPFDRSGQRHMEYLRERGSFRDLPLAQIVADFRAVPALAARPRHAQCAGAGRLPGGRRARTRRWLSNSAASAGRLPPWPRDYKADPRTATVGHPIGALPCTSIP